MLKENSMDSAAAAIVFIRTGVIFYLPYGLKFILPFLLSLLLIHLEKLPPELFSARPIIGARDFSPLSFVLAYIPDSFDRPSPDFQVFQKNLVAEKSLPPVIFLQSDGIVQTEAFQDRGVQTWT